VSPLLLDTCAAIWIAEDEPIAPEATHALHAAANEGITVFVSPMSGWEVGMLTSRKRLTITMEPEAWFEKLLSVPGLRLAPISVRMLVASSFLPGKPPRDPVDRIIAATARDGGYRVITRDRGLLDYAEEGHMSALAC
jgi:PIN domain nuclease of toxin-antitoxin system